MFKLMKFESFEPKRVEGRKSVKEIQREKDILTNKATITISEIILDGNMSAKKLSKMKTYDWLQFFSDFEEKYGVVLKDLCSRINVDAYDCYESVDDIDYYEIILSGSPVDIHKFEDLCEDEQESGISI